MINLIENEFASAFYAIINVADIMEDNYEIELEGIGNKSDSSEDNDDGISQVLY